MEGSTHNKILTHFSQMFPKTQTEHLVFNTTRIMYKLQTQTWLTAHERQAGSVNDRASARTLPLCQIPIPCTEHLYLESNKIAGCEG
jgi:hypothetical protein